MDLELEDYQRMTAESFRSLFAQHVIPDHLRELDTAYDAALLRRFVDMGGVDLSLPEEAGGGGGRLVDAVLVGMEVGRSLAPIPYADLVVAARVLARCTGELDPGALTVCAVTTSITQDEDGRVSGEARWVRGGPDCDSVVVVYNSEVLVMATAAPGVRVTPLANLGRLPLAHVEFAGATPVAARSGPEVRPATARAELRVLRAAELMGAGRRAFELAVEYVGIREQFGRTIGSYQAIQHRLADRLASLDAAELLLLRAASYESEDCLGGYAATALLKIADTAERAAKEALQLFGGYGYMLEYDIHLYLRFVKTLGVLAMDASVHDDVLAYALAERAARRPAQLGAR
ncbi:MAG TPA: acyl-CoA dehydrogenase family protein [Pseudonocardia sp.]